jgi:hypothetical protein
MAIKSGKRWARHVVRIGDKRNSWRVLLDKPEGKKKISRTMYRWEYNIRVECYLKLIG